MHRELAGRQVLDVEVDSGTTVSQIASRMEVEFPSLRGFSDTVLVAVNQEYVDPDTELKEGDEVAFIPPVSGGSSFAITEDVIRPELVESSVHRESHGALATFLGVVRDHNEGRRVLYLEYEAYPEMAEGKMRQIGEEIQERWPDVQLAIVHRVGRLEIGEISVAIVAASPHRAEAFAACREAIERLKAEVPIWKKEFFEDGSVWIGRESASPVTGA
jgi:molybdopterin synthase catalytic subunit